jgi:hypothetical protein
MINDIGPVGMIPNLMHKMALTQRNGIAIWIGLMFIEHLDLLYGKAAAGVIIDNCASKIVLSFKGSNPDKINRLIGDDQANEFRTIASDKALIISQNRNPIVLPKTFFTEKAAVVKSGGIMKRLLDCGQYLMGFFFALLIMIILVASSQNGEAQTPATPSLQTGPSVDTVSAEYVAPKRDAFSNKVTHSSAGVAGVSIGRVSGSNAGNVTNATNATNATNELLPWPSFDERLAQWTARCDQARSAGLPAPSISEKYLIEELYISGRFDSPDGKGVFLKLKDKPNVVLFARAGQKFWNGSVVRIDRDKVEFSVAETEAANYPFFQIFIRLSGDCYLPPPSFI